MLDIWSGIKSVFSGGVKILVGAGQAVWAAFKFAVKAAIWFISGVFSLAKHAGKYLGKLINKLFTPKKVIVVPPKPLKDFEEWMKEKARNGEVYEDEEVLELEARCAEAEKNNESLILAEGVDENGETSIANPEFVRADEYEEKISKANRDNAIYTRKIRIAG